MSIKVLVELTVKLEKLTEITSLFAKLLNETRSSEGGEGVTVCSDQDLPTTILLIEQWNTRDRYEKYNQWRTARGDLAMLSEWLQTPPQRRFFEFVDV